MIFCQLIPLFDAIFCNQFDSIPCISAAMLSDVSHFHAVFISACATFAMTIRMNAFSWTYATRVGEAGHPGPIRIAITNPTAILRKVGDLVSFGAEVICASETSATLVTQQQVSKSFSKVSYRSFWSLAAQPQFESRDDRPSFRGEAVGTAIFSKLPCRNVRISIPPALWNSARFSCAIVRLHQTDVLFISVYGFAGANKVQRGVKMNDLLLTYVWDIIQQVGWPFIVAGDFNEPPNSLPVFKFFSDAGAFELHSWVQHRWGKKLEPTCRGATHNDTVIFHPWFSSFILDAVVDHEHRIDDHSPVFVDLDFSAPVDMGTQWSIPQCWAPFAPPKEVIAKHFKAIDCKFPLPDINCNEDVVEALHQWSSQVEQSIHNALVDQHDADHIRFPWNGLPKKFRGRCSDVKDISYHPPKPVGNDRRNGYTPPNEVFSLPVKLKCKQIRRLLSFQCALKATACHDQQKLRSLRQEWRCICNAKGFGKSWLWWILAFEAIPYRPVDLPDYHWLDVAIAISKVDCDHAVHQEVSNRRKSFRLALKYDKDDDFSKLAYKIVRGSNSPSISEVPACHSCQAALGRLSKGKPFLVVQDQVCPQFRTHSEAFFGNASITLLQQDAGRITFEVKEGVVPSHGTLRQDFVACSPGELYEEFSKFWSPFWLRDSHDDQFTEQGCESFLEEINLAAMPQFPEIQIDLQDVALWERAIHDLKPFKAHGCCGWRHEELKCLPTCAIQKLALLFSKFQGFAFSGDLMKAKTILLPKSDNPTSMNQIRPITIISSLFRLYGKVVFRKVADAWGLVLPAAYHGWPAQAWGQGPRFSTEI